MLPTVLHCQTLQIVMYEVVTSIPVSWWITNPDKVKEYLKTAEKQMK